MMPSLNSGMPLPAPADHGDSKQKGAEQWSAFIGIVTAIVGNILISFALNLQRYAHIRLNRNRLRSSPSWKSGKSLSNGREASSEQRQADGRQHEGTSDDNEATPLRTASSGSSRKSANEKEPAQPSKNYLRSPIWWAGITLMVIGEAGNFLAYGFAPASIVSPLGVVAIISNCIIAPFLLRERFRQRDFWGVLIAIGGVVTVVLSAESRETRMGPDAIWDAISRWEFLLYLGLTAGAMALLIWVSHKYGDRTVLIDVGLVALFGGYTALSTKGVASLLSTTLWRAPTFPITYLLVAILVATALMQIRYLNKALQRFNATQVIPTQFVLFTISVIVGSAVLYRDFESATAERVGKFVGGCALTFLGVYFITSKRNDDDDADGNESEDDAADVEEGIHLMHDERRPSAIPAASENGFGAPGPSRPSIVSRPSIASRRSSNYGTLQRLNSKTSAPSSRPRSPQDADADAESLAPEAAGSSATLTPTKPPLPKSVTTPAATRDELDSDATIAAGDSTPRSRPGPNPGVLKSHRSISRLIPGPLSSPLSSPLSGVVMDRLRRGLDSPSHALRQARLPSSVRRWRSQHDGDAPANDDEDGAAEDSPLGAEDTARPSAESYLRAQVPQEDTSTHSGTGNERRARSVSETLGSIFRTPREHEGQPEERSKK